MVHRFLVGIILEPSFRLCCHLLTQTAQRFISNYSFHFLPPSLFFSSPLNRLLHSSQPRQTATLPSIRPIQSDECEEPGLIRDRYVFTHSLSFHNLHNPQPMSQVPTRPASCIFLHSYVPSILEISYSILDGAFC